MPESTEEYHETNDIYLAMLRNAQSQEDKKLVQLIQGKMINNRPRAYITESGCKVIPHPLSIFPIPKTPESGDFWKDQRFWKELIQVLAVVSFFLVWFIYFIVLLAENNIK